MLHIFSDTIKTATRQQDWDAPRTWQLPDEGPPLDRRTAQRDRGALRRWLRATGIL